MSDGPDQAQESCRRGWFSRHPRITRGLAFTLFLVVFDIVLGTTLFHLGIVVLPSAGYYRLPDSRMHHVLRANVTYDQAHFGSLKYPVRTNSLGLRDGVVREVSRAKVTKRRLLLLGDSFTEGIGCRWEDTFAGMLDLAPDWEVLNGGVASYSPVFYYCLAHRLLVDEEIEVDQVLVFIDPGDVIDSLKYSLRDTDPPSVDGHETLLDERIKSFVGTHTVLLHALRYGYRHLRHSLQPPPPYAASEGRAFAANSTWADNEKVWREVGKPGLAAASGYMEHLAKLLEANGIGMTVVVYPYPAHVTRRQHDFANFAYWRDWTRARGHGFINLAPDFFVGPAEQVLKECYIDGDVHWSPGGHRRVAARLLKELKGR